MIRKIIHIDEEKCNGCGCTRCAFRFGAVPTGPVALPDQVGAGERPLV